MTTCSLYFLASTLVVLISCASFADEVPVQTFSINDATVGITTLDEVQKIYGRATPARVGTEEEADVTVCYSSSNGEQFVVFESGVMGGYKYITGFRITSRRPDGNCVSTNIDVSALATGNGVRLGQSPEDFEKAIPIEFKRLDSELTYEAVSQRAVTQEELKRLRARWPNEKQDYFDVTTVITAKFQDNRLIDFYVHKIESY